MDDIGDHRLRDLKLELKFWERSFAAAHGGRKPAKTDIKADAAICTHAAPSDGRDLTGYSCQIQAV